MQPHDEPSSIKSKRGLAIVVPAATFVLVYAGYLLTNEYWKRYDAFIAQLFEILDSGQIQTVGELAETLEEFGGHPAENSENVFLFENSRWLSVHVAMGSEETIEKSDVVHVSDPLRRQGPWFAQVPSFERRLGYCSIAASAFWATSFAVRFRAISWVMRAASLIAASPIVFWMTINALNIYAYGG